MDIPGAIGRDTPQLACYEFPNLNFYAIETTIKRLEFVELTRHNFSTWKLIIASGKAGPAAPEAAAARAARSESFTFP